MRKICILTFQRAINYGAVLQMYALQKVLSEHGYAVNVLDYYSEAVFSGYKPFDKNSFKSIKLCVSQIINYKYTKNRNRKFYKFIKENINLTETVRKNELKCLENQYDKFVVGSDQVWNPEITNHDSTYFLDFVHDSGKKRSYAASLGISKWDTSSFLPLKQLVESFSVLSVRETTARNIIKSVVEDKKINIDLDPVFLLQREVWERFRVKKKCNKAYILVYTVGTPLKVYEYAKKLADKENLEIINIRYKMALRNRLFDIGHTIYDASPEDFVSLIANSKYVVTNSFHATAFSIIFNKEMFIELPQGLGSRIEDLLCSLGITGRYIDDEKINNIEWAVVNSKLQNAMRISLNHLLTYMV